MLAGQTPFVANSIPELVANIVSPDFEIQIPASVSSEGATILNSLLQRKPDDRISFHDFFLCEYLDLEHFPNAESLEKGMAVIKEGVKQDEQRHYADALDLYQEGIGFLLAAIQCKSHLLPTTRKKRKKDLKEMFRFHFAIFSTVEEDERRVELLRSRCQAYMSRAEELKNLAKDSKPTQESLRNFLSFFSFLDLLSFFLTFF